MLAPNVNNVMDDLAQAHYTITKIDSFAYASRNTLIGVLSPDPAWLAPVRNTFSLLRNEGGQWKLKKPDFWAPLLSTFTVYSAAFSAYAGMVNELGDNKEAWIKILTDLRDSLNNNAITARVAEQQINQHIQDLDNVQTLLITNLDKAWAELCNQEQAMVELAGEIVHLQDQVDQLSSSLTAKEIAAGQTYIETAATITYTVATAAATFSIPYLTIAGLVFTTSKMAYDLISNDPQIRDSLIKINQKRGELTYEAGAAAMTKGIIQLICGFDKSLTALQNQMPKFSVMWNTEKVKIQDIILTIQSGVDPQSFLSLFTMPAAAATWKEISDFITKLTAMVPTTGTPVYLTPGEDPIRTTF